jgi:hypothetical protein
MDIVEEKINKVKVRPFTQTVRDDKKPKAWEMIPTYCSVVAVIARKAVGKTTLLGNILRKAVSPHTLVWIFASTVKRDQGWKDIVSMLEEKDITVEARTNFIDEEDGVSWVKKFMDEAANPDEEGEDGEDGGDSNPYTFPTEGDTEEDKPKKRKSKYLEYDHVFCFDDLGDALRDKSITQLAKTGRHYKSLILVSSQKVHDLPRGFWSQVGVCLVSKGVPQPALMNLHQNLDLSIEPERFEELYDRTTKDKDPKHPQHNFLWIGLSSTHEEYRKNFNVRLKVPIL